jgi:hypothetical protein
MEAEPQNYLNEIRISLASITEKVTRLDKNMNGNGVPGLLDRVKSIELKHEAGMCGYVRVEADLNEKIDDAIAERKLVTDGIKSDVKKIIDVLPGLTYTNKILVWVGSALGLSAIALIWAIITHAVTIVK